MKEEGKSENKKQIAKQSSKGYNYHYASLADFAKQGFVIPVMRTRNTEFGEYIEYKDENGEWQQGAKVVMLDESKAMNSCQRYGAALSYARRYSVALALGLATDDDDNVENHEPKKSTSTKPLPASEAQLKFIDNLLTKKGYIASQREEALKKITTMAQATEAIAKLKGEA